MGMFRTLTGSVRVALTGADPLHSLHAICDMGISVWDMVQKDELTVEFTILRCHLMHVQNMAESKNETFSILSYGGMFWFIQRMLKRPLLICGSCILIFLTLYLPGRILFLEVEGNASIPDNMILEAAREAGIAFGQSRRAARSEKLKNKLLNQLPQLQWAGLNTHGCTAVITVRERVKENRQKKDYEISNIVASCDGVITSCTVTGGTALCQEGQVVKEGQVLISGYSDCGGVILADRAEGEIFAKTRHEMTAVTPVETFIRGENIEKRTQYGICFGKKRINFYKGSGIYTVGYVKMVARYQLTLPGNFKLPLTFIREDIYDYHLQNGQIRENDAAQRLSACAKASICDNGFARQITDAKESIERKNDLLVLNGVYHCVEMIGREQSAQIGDLHGKTD